MTHQSPSSRLTGGTGPYPFIYGRHLLIAIELFAYGDESGIDSQRDPYCIVAGYVGTPAQWGAYLSAWSEVLSRRHAGRFHAKRFFARDKAGERLDEYRGWSDAEAKDFIEELCDVIRSCALTAAGCAVDVRCFNAYSYGERKFLTGGVLSNDLRWQSTGSARRPYYVAFQKFVAEVAELVGEDTTVNFIFDIQRILSGRAVDTFHEVLKHSALESTKRLGGVGYAESTRRPHLQAADLLTHLWYSWLVKGDAMDGERQHAMGLVTAGPGHVGVYAPSVLEDTLSRLPPSIRDRLRLARFSDRRLPSLQPMA